MKKDFYSPSGANCGFETLPRLLTTFCYWFGKISFGAFLGYRYVLIFVCMKGGRKIDLVLSDMSPNLSGEYTSNMN
jgi:hypothetical protein